MHTCDIVDLDYFGQSPNCYQAEVEVAATPEQVFACFEDADAWPQWAMPIQKVEWTSPKPFGVGTTRTVSMMAGFVGDERFIAWDYPREMAFCFTHCSRSLVKSFAEHYTVTPLANGKTNVVWKMAMDARGIGKYSMALSGPFMRWGMQYMFNQFKAYLERNIAQYS